MNGLCRLTVLDWQGELPLPGHYVKAERGRTAFLIVEVRRPRVGVKHVARFICERERATSLRADAIVHSWWWARR